MFLSLGWINLPERHTELRKSVQSLEYWFITMNMKGYESTARQRDTWDEVLSNRASVLTVWIWLSEGVLGHEPGSYPDPLL